MKEQHFNCRAVCLAVIFFCAINSVNSYSKYGRSCADIGCTPSEVCIMAQESCSYGQRDGKDCGSYPTCKRNPNGGSIKPSGASLNPAPDNTIFSPSSNPTLNTNLYNNNNRLKPTPIDGNYVFGSPNVVPVNSNNMPIFPYSQPTNPPSFQQFPQPNHPGSGFSSFPHNMQPQNPYNPPFVFGQLPFFNPGGTGGPPGGGGGGLSMGGGSSSIGGYQNPNMYNKPPQYLPNLNPYNRQTQSHPSSAVSLTAPTMNVFVFIIACIMGLVCQQSFSFTAKRNSNFT